MDRCDCCGSQLEGSGIWLVIDHRQYHFCSSNCLNKYEPEAGREVVVYG